MAQVQHVSLKTPRALLERNLPHLSLATKTLLALISRGIAVQLGQYEQAITAGTKTLVESVPDKEVGHIPAGSTDYRDVVLAMLAAVQRAKGAVDNLVTVAKGKDNYLYMPDLVCGREAFRQSEFPEWNDLDKVATDMAKLSPSTLLRVAWFLHDRANGLPPYFQMPEQGAEATRLVTFGRVSMRPDQARLIPGARIMGINFMNDFRLSCFGSFWGGNIYYGGQGGMKGCFSAHQFVKSMDFVGGGDVVKLEAKAEKDQVTRTEEVPFKKIGSLWVTTKQDPTLI